MIISNKASKLLRIDDYKVLSCLGKGSFGTLYYSRNAKDPTKEYALKLLHHSYNVAAIQNQLDVLKILNSSELFLKTYASKKVLNKFLIVFEYTDGPHINTLTKEEKFSESMIFEFLVNMLDILEFLQKNSIIHGDIKAENIIKKGNSYYLVDYDVVKRLSPSKTLHVQNDDDFTAPEIYKGVQTFASDIYSLGCTIFYMLTQKHIYGFNSATTFGDKMFAHLYETFDFDEKLSKKMLYLIARMVEKDHMKRASLDEIRTILYDDFIYTSPLHVNSSIGKSLSELEKYHYMAGKGIAYAQNILGLIYEEGVEVEKDLVQAFKWYKLASDQGLIKAHFNLALCYYHAKGCSLDYVKAKELFVLASKEGHSRSYFYLAQMFELGYGVEADTLTAQKLYKKSAYFGYPAAYKKI